MLNETQAYKENINETIPLSQIKKTDPYLIHQK